MRGVVLWALVAVASAATCFDGIDNDWDGLVDLEDPDCLAAGANTEQLDGDPADAYRAAVVTSANRTTLELHAELAAAPGADLFFNVVPYAGDDEVRSVRIMRAAPTANTTHAMVQWAATTPVDPFEFGTGVVCNKSHPEDVFSSAVYFGRALPLFAADAPLWADLDPFVQATQKPDGFLFVRPLAADAAAPWTEIPLPEGIVSGSLRSLVAFTTSRDEFFAAAKQDPDATVPGPALLLYTGSAWEDASTGIDVPEVFSLHMSRRDEAELFATGRPSGLFRSENGGATWTRVSDAVLPDRVLSMTTLRDFELLPQPLPELVVVDLIDDTQAGQITVGFTGGATAQSLAEAFPVTGSWVQFAGTSDPRPWYVLEINDVRLVLEDTGDRYEAGDIEMGARAVRVTPIYWAGTDQGLYGSFDAETWHLQALPGETITELATFQAQIIVGATSGLYSIRFASSKACYLGPDVVQGDDRVNNQVLSVAGITGATCTNPIIDAFDDMLMVGTEGGAFKLYNVRDALTAISGTDPLCFTVPLWTPVLSERRVPTVAFPEPLAVAPAVCRMLLGTADEGEGADVRGTVYEFANNTLEPLANDPPALDVSSLVLTRDMRVVALSALGQPMDEYPNFGVLDVDFVEVKGNYTGVLPETGAVILRDADKYQPRRYTSIATGERKRFTVTQTVSIFTLENALATSPSDRRVSQLFADPLEVFPVVCGVPQCFDAFDGDFDGWTDEEDPDCMPFGTTPESGFSDLWRCNDGKDNNYNLLIDAEDPLCTHADSGLEIYIPTQSDSMSESHSPSQSPDECHDGVDNDNDGWADELDADCNNGTNTRELGFSRAYSCNDGRDNDYDELIDRDDPDCVSGFSNGEPRIYTQSQSQSQSQTETMSQSHSESETPVPPPPPPLLEDGEIIGVVVGGVFLIGGTILYVFKRREAAVYKYKREKSLKNLGLGATVGGQTEKKPVKELDEIQWNN